MHLGQLGQKPGVARKALQLTQHSAGCGQGIARLQRGLRCLDRAIHRCAHAALPLPCHRRTLCPASSGFKSWPALHHGFSNGRKAVAYRRILFAGQALLPWACLWRQFGRIRGYARCRRSNRPGKLSGTRDRSGSWTLESGGFPARRRDNDLRRPSGQGQRGHGVARVSLWQDMPDRQVGVKGSGS